MSRKPNPYSEIAAWLTMLALLVAVVVMLSGYPLTATG